MTTLQERCRIAEQCLPDAPYRAMLKNLHNEMLAALAQQESDNPFQPDWASYQQGYENGKADTLEQQGEPVAFLFDEAKYMEGDLRGRQWMPKISRHPPSVPWMQRNVVPLYTAAPAPQPAQGEYRRGWDDPRDALLAPTQKPMAYITETEKGDMVWTPEMYGEACTYCDDGEFPVPLYKSAEPIKQPQVTFWSPSSSAKQATHYPNTKE